MSDTLTRWNAICSKLRIPKSEAFILYTYPILAYYKNELKGSQIIQYRIETAEYNRVIDIYRIGQKTADELWHLAALHHDEHLNTGIQKDEMVSLYHQNMPKCPIIPDRIKPLQAVSELLKENQLDLLIRVAESLKSKAKTST